MAVQRSATSRKSSKAPARRKAASVKDLPNIKAEKVVGGVDSSYERATTGPTTSAPALTTPSTPIGLL